MQYLMPTRADEALAAMQDATVQGDALRVVAGCTDVYPSLPQGTHLGAALDITGIEGWRGLSETEEGWRIGAATTWTDLVRTPLPPAFDALKAAAREVGSIQIQNRATLAGNLCNASPAADGVPPLLALDAEVETASASGTRRVPLGRFITGVRQVALEQGELVSAILVPRAATAGGSAFLKLGARTHLVISIAMVAANVEVDPAGRITAARIAVGSCAPVARRMPEMEAEVTGQRPSEIGPLDAPGLLAPLSPISDVRGSDTYRLDAVPALCRRALVAAAGEGA